MSAPVLKVSGLKKAYGAIQAVGGVSFEVMPGEIFGVIGPNGSGKTTLFNSMLGQITPDAGRIELKGQDVTQLGPLELNRRGVGRTFDLGGMPAGVYVVRVAGTGQVARVLLDR